jgi:hypothetical protein
MRFSEGKSQPAFLDRFPDPIQTGEMRIVWIPGSSAFRTKAMQSSTFLLDEK